MDLIIVQSIRSDMFQQLAESLPDSVSLLPVEDAVMPTELDKHKGDIKAIVLFELTEAANRFCELVRNGRFCHPWTPIAIIDKQPTVAGPVGSSFFSEITDENLIPYLSKPASKSILVIEDDKNIRQYLSLCLGSHYNIETASNAEDGELLYSENQYDLIILDVMLPGINGDEFMMNIRETDSTMPILIVTAYDTSKREADFNQLGATDYMTKPFKGNDAVRSRVMSVLSNAHLRSFDLNDSNNEAWQIYSSRVGQYLE